MFQPSQSDLRLYQTVVSEWAPSYLTGRAATPTCKPSSVARLFLRPLDKTKYITVEKIHTGVFPTVFSISDYV